MKQIIQSFKTGETLLEEIPVPVCKKGAILIQTTHSLVSLGTEKMLVQFGNANLFEKVLQQPDKVRQVLDKMQTDGVIHTVKAVFKKLEQPLPMGYCNVGIVREIGEGVTGFTIGDRVASNGPHAEYVCVPQNLAARIPETVTNEQATFTVIGAIALQGIRLASPTLGETVVVVGLGLIGLLTAQLLKANGCRVIGVDIDEHKLALAESFGILSCNSLTTDVVNFVHQNTVEVGADAVIITASAKTNDIISQAAKMSRKRGRIILVGVIGLELNRAEFYEKELSFQVSCSYGPGRYDEKYEQQGIDYPLPFVRWTEKRNFEVVLQAIASGNISVQPLITERVDLKNYQQIYSTIGKSRSIASILQYDATAEIFTHSVSLHTRPFAGKKAVIGIIGAGNFTKMTMLPALAKSGAHFKNIVSANGVSGTTLAKKYGFASSTTRYEDVLEDVDIDTVLITTQHHLHAEQIVASLQAGKHVFVEKPLALNHHQLSAIVDAFKKSDGQLLQVGFNRRFSKHSIALKKALGSGPLNIVMTINAGFIPPGSWVHDPATGGGRIIGEACHFIDLCIFFTGSLVLAVSANALGAHQQVSADNVTILLKHANGSNSVINYFSNGNKSYPKERIEVYSQQRTAVIDNFKTTTGYGLKQLKKLRTSIDKGHENQFREFVQRIQSGGQELIPFEQTVNATQASFAVLQSLHEHGWITI
jgi:predicted dehydrogenase/threonine dehydrogenase-like Zn-dependent dehydrogenase